MTKSDRHPAILSPSETEEDEDPVEKAPDPVPETRVAAEMENLFRIVEQDRSKAAELKAFLDRNGIFKKYENRFLDLFRDPEAGEQVG